MRAVFVALALTCLALAHGACASGDKQNSGNTDNVAAPAPASNAKASTLPPLPAGADARAYYERGVEAYKKNLDGEAVEAFEQTIRLEPEMAEAHYRLGLAYSAVGRDEDAEKSFEGAVKRFRQTVDKESDNAEAQFYLGLAYGKLGKYAEAVKAFRQAVRQSPDDSEKHYELGLAYSKLAQYREAVGALEKAIDLDPNNHRALEALERARAGLDRRADFLKQLEKMKKGRANANASPSPGPSPAPTP